MTIDNDSDDDYEHDLVYQGLITDYCPPVSETQADRLCASAARYDAYMRYDDADITDELINNIMVPADDYSGDGLEGYADPVIYGISEATRNVFGLLSGDKLSVLTKEVLARRWGIGLETAEKTLKVTTQKGVRQVLHPVERRYRPYQANTLTSTYPGYQFLFGH